MRVLLDTNIIIHREATTVINDDIGVLFRWLDNLHYSKCIHPLTVDELAKHEDAQVRRTFKVKATSYNVLRTTAPVADEVQRVGDELDVDENDRNDTLLINELYSGRVEALVTEDRKIHTKGALLDIADRVYTIDAFLEKVTRENPEQADYKVLAVQKTRFGNVDLADDFFDSFKADYPGFERWFNRKADEPVYVCRSEETMVAFLYLKVEGTTEDYSDISPPFARKKRLKIGTFKVELNGFRLGERFLKIVFDNALIYGVDEIYVTIFDKQGGQQRLMGLLEEFGFTPHGQKNGPGGAEVVYVRTLARVADRSAPKLTYPFFSSAARAFVVPIYPEYHTELFPDSILRTESPADFLENEPHRNAISKVYISRSIERDLKSGDVVVFYRTGGLHRSVVTTLGVIEDVTDNIACEDDFVSLCRQRSVFTDEELSQQWNHKSYGKWYRPFVVNFLYTYSFPKRINMRKLIEMGVLKGPDDAPRGFRQISLQNLKDIMEECEADARLIVD